MPTTKRDYYEILGVRVSASARQIREAYRRIVQESLSARSRGAKQLEQATLAYKVLCDPRLRDWYDRHGVVGLKVSAPKDPRKFAEELFADTYRDDAIW